MDRNFEPCPNCKSGYLREIGEHTGGFSGGKAALGYALVGPLGLLAGTKGKKIKVYRCKKCGYTVEG